MKYKFGDLVYHIPTVNSFTRHYEALQVLSFDEKRNKYKCMSFDLGYLYEVLTIWYCDENELNYLKNIDDISLYLVNGNIPFPNPNIDDSYFSHYDVSGAEVVQFKKAIRQRKPFDVPLK